MAGMPESFLNNPLCRHKFAGKSAGQVRPELDAEAEVPEESKRKQGGGRSHTAATPVSRGAPVDSAAAEEDTPHTDGEQDARTASGANADTYASRARGRERKSKGTDCSCPDCDRLVVKQMLLQPVVHRVCCVLCA